MTGTPRDTHASASAPGPAPPSTTGATVHAAEERRRQDEHIAAAFTRERNRLWRFIRSRVAEHMDAEDILQDVFYELVVAYRLVRPIEHLGAWLFQVARNRITDRFRRRGREVAFDERATTADDGAPGILDLLPAPGAGPEADYARNVMLAALEDALAELPRTQRDIFIAHEIEGRSFKEISAGTGVGINTLLSRKRYAVLHLRRRLQAIHDDFAGRDTDR